ncbi:BZ3500_MvSof-1268-A1-R1_Chr10-2g02942 [Microbotryum saponariae]|uniref:BZ3500_MvSof-1268-A1-R1_Chr10-2g02942 protein n=1 Tax=Microbotryum saponariae TaxID=289078 RepID=A0A2X0KQI0_9BASI|nr:BZ3501_MvSof-1269-A2-R1_Chr10-2g02528 [Microbotryum saponariae]SDA01787.1 BZ3500_MvSof-1268-A1-R1_Chr10-2g02942 [Microbotryum saponariae]
MVRSHEDLNRIWDRSRNDSKRIWDRSRADLTRISIRRTDFKCVSNRAADFECISNHRADFKGKWVNAASKWCNYQLRARVYPRSLTHLPR